MPIFEQTFEAPEVAGLEDYIKAQLPGATDLVIVHNNKILKIEAQGVTQVAFDAMVAGLATQFPRAMAPDNLYIVPFFFTPGAAAVPWVMPAAPTEFLGLTIHRTGAHLAYAKRIRLICNVITPSAAGARLGLQWATSGAGPWAFLNAANNGPNVDVDVAGVIRGNAFIIDGVARKDVMLRLVGVGGNGSTSSSFGTIVAQAIR